MEEIIKKLSCSKFGLIGILLIHSSVSAQEYIQLDGIIKNQENIPLEYANVIAQPLEKSESIAFAISSISGKFQIKLLYDQSYTIHISYLGYETIVYNYEGSQIDLSKHFVLKPSYSELNEVSIVHTPPILIKKDTILYNTDSFVSGKERKLREVLKKLPGVEVDRYGNVKVMGKMITKVLVEGKTFFTGDSKLAVNNIPADAVDKVQILDNYSEVTMLKGLEDSEQMAMNIQLKKNKKNFVFGDMEFGAGLNKRIIAQPNLFYYSPKTNLSLIGDFNNIGLSAFTLKDFINYQGGIRSLMEDSNKFLLVENREFYASLLNKNFISHNKSFGAANVRHSLDNASDINGYIIASTSNIKTKEETFNEYFSDEYPIIERRIFNNDITNFFMIGQVSLDYEPSIDTDLSIISFFKLNNGKSNGKISTFNPGNFNGINTFLDNESLSFKQNVDYNKKLSIAHTATLNSTYSYNKSLPFTKWVTDMRILQGLIPLQDDEYFNIVQDKRLVNQSFSAVLKDYWVLNNFNHLYSTVGINLTFNDFFSRDFQELTNGGTNDFSSNGFGNNLKHSFTNTYIGLEYKFQIGIATLKPMFYWHYYTWQTKQEVRNVFKTNLLLPQFTAKIEFNNSEKINFRYSLNPQFIGVERLASNFILSDFNQVYRGKDKLENPLYHSASLIYYKFSLFRNLNLNLGTSFRKNVRSLKNVVQLEGIESFATPIIFDRPEHSWSVNGRISKKLKKIKYNLETVYNYSDFYQIVNNEENLNISKTILAKISGETFFKALPNIETGYSKSLSRYTAFTNPNKFENDKYFVFLEYDFLEDFIFKADYTYELYRNESINSTNTFDIANASLFYQKEDSPWGFEVSGTNLFDVNFKQQNSFSNFLISDSKTFIIPRIIMFKLIYKL